MIMDPRDDAIVPVAAVFFLDAPCFFCRDRAHRQRRIPIHRRQQHLTWTGHGGKSRRKKILPQRFDHYGPIGSITRGHCHPAIPQQADV